MTEFIQVNNYLFNLAHIIKVSYFPADEHSPARLNLVPSSRLSIEDFYRVEGEAAEALWEHLRTRAFTVFPPAPKPDTETFVIPVFPCEAHDCRAESRRFCAYCKKYFCEAHFGIDEDVCERCRVGEGWQE